MRHDKTPSMVPEIDELKLGSRLLMPLCPWQQNTSKQVSKYNLLKVLFTDTQ